MSFISKRAFGADLPEDVKQKLENIEAFGSGIFDPQIRDESFQYDNFEDEASFGGQAFYNTKTPFARMWTAVSIVEKTDKVDTIQNPQPAALDDIDVNKFRYELTPGDNPSLKVTEIARTPNDGLGKIYSLGTYNLTTGDRGVNESAVSEEFDPNSILPTQRERYTDTDFSDAQTKRLRPPAGITSVRSSTRGGSYGPLQGVLKTTVAFTVYDFEEFDQIYSRYFLRPGAQIFVDFGWTHKKNFTLYNPKELLKQEETNFNAYNEVIFGKIREDGSIEKNGQWQNSDYDIQFIRGLVTNCRADLDPGSLSWNCEIEIMSENISLANPTLVEDTALGKSKENMLSNLDYKILVTAAEQLFPEKFKGDNQLFPNTNFTTDDVKLYGKLTEEFASEFLGNKDKNVPTQLNVDLGIYWKGVYKTDENGVKIPSKSPGSIYVSWGWFEDNILNKEFARGSNFDVDTFDLPGTPEDGKQIKFRTSINNRTFWSEKLYLRQTFTGDNYQGLPFLFPDNWDTTYNTKRAPNPKNWEGKTEAYKQFNRIPIKEIFIKLDILKTAIREADSLNEVFTYISRQMQNATGNNWNWQKQEQDLQGFTLGFNDILQVSKETFDAEGNQSILDVDQILSLNQEDIFKNLYEFKPGSPKSIVKNMSLNLSYGGSDLISSQVALSGLGSTGNTILPVSDLIEQAQSMEIINQAGDREGKLENFEVEFVPSTRTSEIEKIIKSNISKKLAGYANPDRQEIKNTSYLSNDALYAKQSGYITDQTAAAKSLEKIIDKSSEIKKENSVKFVKPSNTPTFEYKDAKRDFINLGNSYASSVFEFYTDTYVEEAIVQKPTIMNFDVNLQLYGINAFVVGDIFQIGMIPKRIKNLVYFQVYNIEHSINPGDYTTTLGCKMLLRPDLKAPLYEKSTSESGIVIEPSCLATEFKLLGISKVLPFFLYVLPSSSVLAGSEAFDYVFVGKTFKGGNSAKISELFESFDISTEDGVTESTEYFDKLESPMEQPVSLGEVSTEKTKSIFKKYSFKPETNYHIYIKNNKWIIFESPNSSGATEYFKVLFPPPKVPPVSETSAAVAK